MYLINILFLLFELVIGFLVYIRFSNTQSAAFYRRTAPVIDKKFKKKYDNISGESVGAGYTRSVQLGMRKLTRNLEKQDKAFADSNQ